jgi:hypothetical protein
MDPAPVVWWKWTLSLYLLCFLLQLILPWAPPAIRHRHALIAAKNWCHWCRASEKKWGVAELMVTDLWFRMFLGHTSFFETAKPRPVPPYVPVVLHCVNFSKSKPNVSAGMLPNWYMHLTSWNAQICSRISYAYAHL